MATESDSDSDDVFYPVNELPELFENLGLQTEQISLQKSRLSPHSERLKQVWDQQVVAEGRKLKNQNQEATVSLTVLTTSEEPAPEFTPVLETPNQENLSPLPVNRFPSRKRKPGAMNFPVRRNNNRSRRYNRSNNNQNSNVRQTSQHSQQNGIQPQNPRRTSCGNCSYTGTTLRESCWNRSHGDCTLQTSPHPNPSSTNNDGQSFSSAGLLLGRSAISTLPEESPIITTFQPDPAQTVALWPTSHLNQTRTHSHERTIIPPMYFLPNQSQPNHRNENMIQSIGNPCDQQSSRNPMPSGPSSVSGILLYNGSSTSSGFHGTPCLPLLPLPVYVALPIGNNTAVHPTTGQMVHYYPVEQFQYPQLIQQIQQLQVQEQFDQEQRLQQQQIQRQHQVHREQQIHQHIQIQYQQLLQQPTTTTVVVPAYFNGDPNQYRNENHYLSHFHRLINLTLNPAAVPIVNVSYSISFQPEQQQRGHYWN